jgi:hypothetical protein
MINNNRNGVLHRIPNGLFCSLSLLADYLQKLQGTLSYIHPKRHKNYEIQNMVRIPYNLRIT